MCCMSCCRPFNLLISCSVPSLCFGILCSRNKGSLFPHVIFVVSVWQRMWHIMGAQRELETQTFREPWPLYAAWRLSCSMSLSLQLLASCITAAISSALATGLNGSFLFYKHSLCSNCHSCWNKAIYRDAPNYHLLFFFLSKIHSYLI